MVTPLSAKLPVPENAAEFDEMAKDVVAAKYARRDLVHFGRSGQRQGGIDGHGQADGRLVWQSTLQVNNVLQKLRTDLDALDADPDHDPDVFVAVLGLPRDATLQREMVHTSQQRQRVGKCRVDLLFWEDVRGEISGDQSLLRKYYPSFTLDPGNSELTRIQLEEAVAAQRPELHLQYWPTGITGSESERGQVEIRNLGKCAVEVRSVELVWHLRGGGPAPESKNVTGRSGPVLAPAESATVAVGLTFAEVLRACDEAGFARPARLQDAPVRAQVQATAVSKPYGVERLFSCEHRRTRETLSAVIQAAVDTRVAILAACYGEPSGGGGLVELEIAGLDPPAVVREADWLESQGLVQTQRYDLTGVAAELTPIGREYVERWLPELVGGSEPTQSNGPRM